MPQVDCGFGNSGAQGSKLLVDLGPTIQVNIGFDPDYIPASDPPIVPVPGVTGIHALVDTGATESCIDNLLAAQLGLPVVDRRPVSGIHGSHETNMYLAQIHVPTLEVTVYGEFVGVDLQAGGQDHSALMGRTFLRNFQMTYDGRTGSVVIST
jgi:predicted aspartyl protease